MRLIKDVNLDNIYLLHNPIYAGAYAYGRRPTDPRKKFPAAPQRVEQSLESMTGRF